MKVHKLFPVWAACFLIGCFLLLLTGCQSLSGAGSGGGGTVGFSSGNVNFGNVAVGSNTTLQDTLSNTTTSTITISSITGTNATFQVTGLAMPLTIAAGQSATFNIVFQPSALGIQSATISFVADNGQSVSLPVAGNAVAPGQLSMNPASVSFGNIQLGGSQTSSVVLSNSGGTDLTISQATLSGAGFTMSNLALPVTLSSGTTASITITFAPPAAGSYSGSISFATSAAQSDAKKAKTRPRPADTSQVTLPLTGTGVAQGTLASNPSSLSFGSVQVGTNSTLTETLTNTGGSSVTISQATPSGSGFSISGLSLPATVASNQSVSFNVVFNPTVAGAASGSLTVVSNASNSSLSIPLTGTGQTAGSLSSNPASVSFGNVTLGSNKSVSVVVTNTGGETVTLSSAAASGTGFSFTGPGFPVTLNAGASATFSTIFTPTTAGAVSGNFTVNSNAGSGILTVPLSGTGVSQGQLTSSPSSFSFGNVQVGTSSPLSGSLTNSGGSSVTISAASASGTGFSLSGLTLPLTLNAGQSTSFTVLFNPTATGAASGTVTVTSNGSNPTLSIPLAGTGVAQGDLAPNPANISFGNVQVGSSGTQSETLTNNGGTTITVSAATASGAGFSLSGLSLPITLNAGQSTSFSVKFAPTTSGAASGSITVTSNGSNPTLSIPLSGTGVTQGNISPNPASISFGNVQVGTNSTQSETLTNNGGTSVTISAASASGTGFSLSGLSLPLTLNAGQSTSFNVVFNPANTGAVSGSVTITSNGSNPSLSIALSGTGVTEGDLAPNPASISFGNVQVGSSSTQSETLTNNGGTTITISAASASGTGFSLSGLTLPLTLNAGQSTSFSVKFAPTASGAASGSVTITSNGSNPTLSISLSGTGVTQGNLSPNPASISFGSVQVGSNGTQSETLTNNGGTSVTISAASASGTGFSLNGLSLPLTLNAGQSTSFNIVFAPTSAGAASGSVTITSNGSNPSLSIALSGTGVAPGTLSANPASLAFGSVQVGNSSNLSETLTNTGGSSVTISAANLTGSAFSISGLTLPATLTAGQSLTFTATFTPASAGSASGTISVVSNASNSPLSIGLSGTGTAAGQLAVSPTTLSFGSVNIGSSSSLNGSLTASGASVTVSSAVSNSSEFVLSGISFPQTIAAGQSATFTVTFTPNASGTANASLTFTSNASNSPTVESLTGSGTAKQHTVSLSWNASSGASGYNIYRGTTSGGPYSMINSSLNAPTTYTDSTVVSGQTYYYVTTAVNSDEQESGYSNQAQAVIPNP